MNCETMRRVVASLFGMAVLVVGSGSLSMSAVAQEWKSGVEWQEPPIVTPGASDEMASSDAIVLFDGSNLDQWEGGDKWLVEDGVAIPRSREIRSKQQFGDIQLHLEWSAPTEIRGEGQGRGNSGVFLMGLYEVQVLDSFQNTTYFDGQAASIYKQTPPMVNAMRKPGEWNTYDIVFTGPRFKGNGDVEKPGYVTVIHNGLVALNHFELMGPTGFTEAPHYRPHAETGPISLQFHGDAVRFRNIWVRELKSPVGRRVGAPFNIEPKKPRKSKEDQKPADDKPVKDKAADDKPTDDKSADKKPADEKPDDRKPAEKSSDDKAEGKAGDKVK